MLSMIIQFIVLSCYLLFYYHKILGNIYYLLPQLLGNSLLFCRVEGNSIITPRNTIDRTQGKLPLVTLAPQIVQKY